MEEAHGSEVYPVDRKHQFPSEAPKRVESSKKDDLKFPVYGVEKSHSFQDKAPYSEKSLQLQVWSLSSFDLGRQLLRNDLNQVSSLSLFMTSSTALANKGLFELNRCPSLAGAVFVFIS